MKADLFDPGDGIPTGPNTPDQSGSENNGDERALRTLLISTCYLGNSFLGPIVERYNGECQNILSFADRVFSIRNSCHLPVPEHRPVRAKYANAKRH